MASNLKEYLAHEVVAYLSDSVVRRKAKMLDEIHSFVVKEHGITWREGLGKACPYCHLPNKNTIWCANANCQRALPCHSPYCDELRHAAEKTLCDACGKAVYCPSCIGTGCDICGRAICIACAASMDGFSRANGYTICSRACIESVSKRRKKAADEEK